MNYLKQKLEEKHITQKELAIRTGINKGAINYYCNTELKRGMSIETAYLICETLNLDLKEFIEEMLK